jgi:tetratricopeptide (TPR) repeat protein
MSRFARSTIRSVSAAGMTVAGSAALVVGLLIGGCAKTISETSTPSQALVKLIETARTGNEEAFKAGLTKNFVAVIDRYRELGDSRPELKGAFTVATFMRAFAQDSPVPREELVKGTSATVKATKQDGVEVGVRMTFEDGQWKLEVPNGLVTNLDHFDEVAKIATGDAPAPTPDVAVGGGGKADRVKNLPADATEAMKVKAAALDGFDFGDAAGAEAKLVEALKVNPGDDEITVALGRAYVQMAKGPDAIKLFESHLKKSPNVAPVRHYLGMAYMFEKRYLDAANEWKKVIEIDPAYATQYKLADRARIAEGIAADPSAAPGAHQGGGAAPAPTDGANPHGAPAH